MSNNAGSGGLVNEIDNEQFGPERYADQPWWGDSMTPSDNNLEEEMSDARA